MNHIVTLCSLCLFDCLSKKIKTVFYLAILLLSFYLLFWVTSICFILSESSELIISNIYNQQMNSMFINVDKEYRKSQFKRRCFILPWYSIFDKCFWLSSRCSTLMCQDAQKHQWWHKLLGKLLPHKGQQMISYRLQYTNNYHHADNLTSLNFTFVTHQNQHLTGPSCICRYNFNIIIIGNFSNCNIIQIY